MKADDAAQKYCPFSFAQPQKTWDAGAEQAVLSNLYCWTRNCMFWDETPDTDPPCGNCLLVYAAAALVGSMGA